MQSGKEHNEDISKQQYLEIEGGNGMKKLTVALLLAAMTAALAGCGGASASDTASAERTQTDAAAETAGETESSGSQDPVTLRFMWWGGDERAQATLDVIEQFEKEYPWITIEAEYGSSDGYQEKLTTQLTSGTIADIFQMGPGWMPGYVEANPEYFADFNDFTDTMDLTTFDENILKNNGQFDGHQYGLPTGIAGHALIYNEKLAEEIGIDFSQAYTWDDLEEMGKKVKEHDSDLYLLTMGSSTLNTMIIRPYLQQLTGNTVLVNETKTRGFEEADLVQVLTYIKTLYDEGVIAPISTVIAYGDDLQTDPNWISQKYVAAFAYSSTVEVMQAACPDGTFTAGQLPVMTEAKDQGWYVNAPQYLCVSGVSEHQQEAMTFLNYFYNNEEAAATLKTVRSVPPTTVGQQVCTELGILEGVAKDSVDIIQTYTGTNDLGLTTEEEVGTILRDAATQVAYGQGTPEDVAAATIKLLDNYLVSK